MPSGNFLLGNKLSMEGFDHYVRPLLAEKGVKIDDIAVVYDLKGDTLLSSIRGNDLENILCGCLMEASQKADNEIKNPTQKTERLAYLHQIVSYQTELIDGKYKPVNKPIYKKLGLYENDNTASKLFPMIALEYHTHKVDASLDELTDKLKNLGEQLSGI